jgi:hypothetical protein
VQVWAADQLMRSLLCVDGPSQVHYVLDEIIMAGMVLETNIVHILQVRPLPDGACLPGLWGTGPHVTCEVPREVLVSAADNLLAWADELAWWDVPLPGAVVNDAIRALIIFFLGTVAAFKSEVHMARCPVVHSLIAQSPITSSPALVGVLMSGCPFVTTGDHGSEQAALGVAEGVAHHHGQGRGHPSHHPDHDAPIEERAERARPGRLCTGRRREKSARSRLRILCM